MVGREYELKLDNGKVVEWVGLSGEDAARRYVDCFAGAVVVAWRTLRYDVRIYAGEPISCGI